MPGSAKRRKLTNSDSEGEKREAGDNVGDQVGFAGTNEGGVLPVVPVVVGGVGMSSKQSK